MTYGTTTPDGIAYLTSGSAVNPVTESSTQASSVQTALSLRPFYSYVWANAAGRTGQTGMRPGDLGFQADTGVAYQYINSTNGWLTSPTGVGKIYVGSTSVTSFTATPYAVTGNSTVNGFKATVAVTFPTGYFSAAPIVITSPLSSAPWAVSTSPSSVTTTGFNVNVWRTDSATSTTVNWTATL